MIIVLHIYNQFGAVILRLILSKILTKIRLLGQAMECFSVESASYWYSTPITAVIYAISY